MADVLVVAAIWLVLFAVAVAISTAGSRAPAAAPASGFAGMPASDRDLPPALVNLTVTRCRLDGAAYPATILGLAARGGLLITQPQPGRLWCGLPPSPQAGPGLAAFELEVLRAITHRLAATGPAPLDVLADQAAADVPGTWDPFERGVRHEGRRRGLVRPRLPAGVTSLLNAGAAAFGFVTYLAVHARPHTGTWAALTSAFLAVLLPAYWTRCVARQDRLTRSGALLAAWSAATAADQPAWTVLGGPGSGSPLPADAVARLSRAVAAHVPVPVAGVNPGGRTGVRPGRRRAAARTGISGLFEASPRPRAAWSSRSGQWRLVEIPPPGLPLHDNPVAFLAAAAWAGLLCYAASLLSGPAGAILLAAAAAVALTAAAGAARALVRWLAQPAEITVDAQVIARWVERRGSGDDDTYVPCFAVDDGERAWSTETSRGAFARLGVGDPVRVRASPRSRKLLGLVPSGPEVSGGTGGRSG